MAGRTLHVLTGCTATGKTEWALRWAEERAAEILSCDSPLLFYRGMDIGTAKPSAEDRRRVPHHLIDLRDVTEPMNVAAFARLARQTAEEIASRGLPVMAVGGSGFYLKTFFSPVADRVEVPAGIRSSVAGLLASEGLPAAVAELRRLNPDGLGDLDTVNPRRVARALERCLASGLPLSRLAAAFRRLPRPFADWDVQLTRLERTADDLAARISRRVQAMIERGLVAEVRALLQAGLELNPSAARAIGYRETIEMIEGRLDPAELAPRIEQSTRALVKKQRTWFRTQMPPHRVINPD